VAVRDGKERRLWLKRVAWAAGLPAVGAIVSAVVLNPTNLFAGLRALPGEVQVTTDQFWGWYHLDAAWTGHWTNKPEGYVDAGDMHLSAEDIGIQLTVKNGKVEGTISTKSICRSTPFYQFLLVRGDVSGSTDATIVVWDTFQGHNVDIAELELKREGVTMTVVPKQGMVHLFPQEARLAIDPSDTDQGEFCEGRRENVTKTLLNMAEDTPANRLKR
jgi:hypothetical protein